MKRECVQCGDQFKPTSTLNTICSDECRAERHRKATRDCMRKKRAEEKAKRNKDRDSELDISESKFQEIALENRRNLKNRGKSYDDYLKEAGYE